jgi:hypothetical protein
MLDTWYNLSRDFKNLYFCVSVSIQLHTKNQHAITFQYTQRLYHFFDCCILAIYGLVKSCMYCLLLIDRAPVFLGYDDLHLIGKTSHHKKNKTQKN